LQHKHHYDNVEENSAAASQQRIMSWPIFIEVEYNRITKDVHVFNHPSTSSGHIAQVISD
jgi:hypothetical protein